MCIWERRTMPGGGFGIGGARPLLKSALFPKCTYLNSWSFSFWATSKDLQAKYCSLAQTICGSGIANIFYNKKLRVQPCWPSSCWKKYFCRSQPLKKGKNVNEASCFPKTQLYQKFGAQNLEKMRHLCQAWASNYSDKKCPRIRVIEYSNLGKETPSKIQKLEKNILCINVVWRKSHIIHLFL
jgi:hypothetical protein